MFEHETQQVFQHTRIQAVVNELPAPTIGDQVSGSQILEMEGKGTRSHAQRLSQFASASWAPPQFMQDLASRRISQRLESQVVPHHFNNSRSIEL
jgi:hypothetical protein